MTWMEAIETWLIIGFGVTLAYMITFWGKENGIFKPSMPSMFEVPDMSNSRLGMDFLVADLHGTSTELTPQAGDVLILLEIDGMGTTVTRDRRGRFMTGESYPQKGDEDNRLYDEFPVIMSDSPKPKMIKRYELRRCGLSARTWIVSQ